MTKDNLTPDQRSDCMAKIKGKNTTPELLLRKALWEQGMRYRVKSKVFGKPDLLFLRKKIAVFVDGCFWHGCPKHYMKPKSNVVFWERKIKRNMERDKKVNACLVGDGWVVLRFWEHDINDNSDNCVAKIVQSLHLSK